MSWSHDHYPKAHWCGAQTRNPDVNRCPKSLWCFGLLKAWVSDFDPANSSLPYVHSELISDISVNDPYLNPYLIWWSPIFDPIILNPYLTFLVICWWYVPNDIHFISLFFSPKFCTATATATQLCSPRLSHQCSDPKLRSPDTGPSMQSSSWFDTCAQGDFKLQKKGMKLMKPTILGDRTW
jgi:hypothetical protein